MRIQMREVFTNWAIQHFLTPTSWTCGHFSLTSFGMSAIYFTKFAPIEFLFPAHPFKEFGFEEELVCENCFIGYICHHQK